MPLMAPSSQTPTRTRRLPTIVAMHVTLGHGRLVTSAGRWLGLAGLHRTFGPSFPPRHLALPTFPGRLACARAGGRDRRPVTSIRSHGDTRHEEVMRTPKTDRGSDRTTGESFTVRSARAQR